MTDLSNQDLELLYLSTVKGAVGPTLDDARLQVYGDNELSYFAALSGLTPLESYSLADHMYAYYSNGAWAWTEDRRNLALNPKLGVDATGWSFNQTWEVAPARVGIADLPGFDWAWAASQSGALASGQQIRYNIDNPGAGDFRVGFWAKVSSAVGAPLACVSSDTGMNTRFAELSVVTDGLWRWYSLAGVNSAPGVNRYVGLRFSSGQGAPASAAMTGLVWEQSSEGLLTPGSYLDGSKPSSSSERSRWLGAVDASVSVHESKFSSLTDLARGFWLSALGLT